MSQSRKPVAEVLVLAGPTHHRIPLPSGPQDFVPRDRVKLFSPEDLEAAQRLLPARQIKVREFARIEDAPAPAPAPAPAEEVPVVAKKKAVRDQ